MVRLLALVVLVGSLLACASAPEVDTPVGPESVTRALILAEVVKKHPDDPEAALDAMGSSAEELETLLLEIAADSALSDAYAEGLGR
ncbi:MAG: hypothetical protein Q8P41_12175 [Pseudomonadota bacterium]|nr:hypothetical protein [Pseudomonadota bacterium]